MNRVSQLRHQYGNSVTGRRVDVVVDSPLVATLPKSAVFSQWRVETLSIQKTVLPYQSPFTTLCIPQPVTNIACHRLEWLSEQSETRPAKHALMNQLREDAPDTPRRTFGIVCGLLGWVLLTCQYFISTVRKSQDLNASPFEHSSVPPSHHISLEEEDEFSARTACSNLTQHFLQQAFTHVHTKRDFFHIVRQATKLNLTGQSREDSMIRLSHGEGCVRRKLRVHFIGDSITNEAKRSYAQLYPSDATSWKFDQLYVQKANTEALTAAVHTHMNKHPDTSAFFIGGPAVHQLINEHNLYSLEKHSKAVREALGAVSRLADELKVPIAYLTVMTADPLVLSAEPPKRDVAIFGQLSNLDLWISLEREIIVDMQAAGKMSKRVYFLEPWRLAKQCPGVRCDGLHFGSTFTEWNCSSSFGLWDGFLRDWVIASGFEQARCGMQVASQAKWSTKAGQYVGDALPPL